MIWINEHFEEHGYHNEGNHYCKNIKIHTINGFTEKEKDKLYNFNICNATWDDVILPEINNFTENKGVDIYTKGRSGGWLYVDEAKEIDFSHFEDQEEDESDDEYEERMYELRYLFRKLWEFEKWYQETLKEVKEYLKGVVIKDE